MGKGSKPRPFVVDKETFSNNWDAIFSKKQPTVISNYWSIDKELESVVLKDKNSFFVEIYHNGTLLTTLTERMRTLDQAEEIAENAVIEKTWIEDKHD